ncbi:hypothetical protein [Kordiimonas sp. SCSIO 12610]|uniref:hypothetical protein n=1 Tax=Kordiimonas sp. SCSIO 12610 TaxID=2829597 RepID=UPI00210EBF96|nr:hypothetical protein [Kordiimonas sp. SCSIO 12610]UTW56177.1 hypothetical protein KFF44_04575 [Kordiimonas sp. SCSIO 12610]
MTLFSQYFKKQVGQIGSGLRAGLVLKHSALKRGVLLVGLLAFGSFAASAEHVKVIHQGGEETIRGIDLKTMKVCELKQRIASLLGLKIREFDLIGGSSKLSPGKTLKEDRVFNGKRLKVKPAKSSYQCR